MGKGYKTKLYFIITAAVLFCAAAVSVCVGKYSISLSEIFDIIFGNCENTLKSDVFFKLRIPRTVMAIISGISLGVSGSVFQTVFKNPLASPDIIGIAGGANLGAAVSIVVFSSSSVWLLQIGSFAGGIAAVIFVLLLAKLTRSHSTSTYVLSGIIVNSFTRAMIMVIKYFADTDNEIGEIEYWEMGTFGNITVSKIIPVIPVFILSFGTVILLRNKIDMLSLSDNEGRSLGLRVKPLRITSLAACTLLVASSISVTGLICFVGLIAPHISKLLLKKSNSSTLLMSGIIGGIIVLASDIIVRCASESELPVSIPTAVISLPVLVYFLVKRGKWKNG